VELDGRPLTARQKQYLLLYKPKGCLTTYKDPEGRPTVYDLLTGVKDFVFPVGRLDQDTTGLLILTNDSAFGDFITSPESKVPKTYLVKASVLIDDTQLEQLRQGITLSDGPTRPALVKRIRDSAKYSFFEITITEGRNRQVRRMVEALGAKVLKLVRTAIGGIEIGPLEIGKYRPLTAEERLALGRISKKLSRAEHPAASRDREAARAPRRNEKSAHWASENGRRGRNG
jgi:23S rRNA pseudouridine2605 synthase